MEAEVGIGETDFTTTVGSENSIAGANSCVERTICKAGGIQVSVGREIRAGARTWEAWRTDGGCMRGTPGHDLAIRHQGRETLAQAAA